MENKTINGFNFTKLNNTTKRAHAIIYYYKKSKYFSINQCYIKPSNIKQDIEKHIIKTMDENDYNYTIVSYNSMVFSCAYVHYDK